MSTELNAIVLERIEVSPGLIILRVAPEGWELPEFDAGQFAVLGLPGERKDVIWRCRRNRNQTRHDSSNGHIDCFIVRREGICGVLPLVGSIGNIDSKAFCPTAGQSSLAWRQDVGHVHAGRCTQQQSACAGRDRHGVSSLHEHAAHAIHVRRKTDRCASRSKTLLGIGLSQRTWDVSAPVFLFHIYPRHVLRE